MAGDSALILPVVQPERSCGSCTLCCKVLGIPEVPTAADEWCRHAKKGLGCAIYETRPEACRQFVCAWLIGELPLWARPDKIHGVVTGVVSPDLQILQITEDPGWPRVASDALEPVLQGIYAAGAVVTIRCGSDIRVRGRRPTLDKIDAIQVDS